MCVLVLAPFDVDISLMRIFIFLKQISKTVSAKMYAERKAELEEQRAVNEQFEREVFALNVQVSKLKAELAEMQADRNKWQTRW